MQQLEIGAAALGLALTPEQLAQFAAYHRLLAEGNRRVNLTAITGREEVQTRHFLDSLSVCLAATQLRQPNAAAANPNPPPHTETRPDTPDTVSANPESPPHAETYPAIANSANHEPPPYAATHPSVHNAANPETLSIAESAPTPADSAHAETSPLLVIDIGSGAGMPGLPLKLAFPQLRLHLVESVRKKAEFLEFAAAKLGLDGVTVHPERAETLARHPALRDSCGLALGRGVARLPLLLEYALPFCRPGGLVVAHKQAPLEAELDDAGRALSELGGALAGVYPANLPGLPKGRLLASFRKTAAATPERYPRRPGIPAKRPL